MAGCFLVVGLGTFGSRVAKALFQGGAYVLAVDSAEEQVNALRDDASKAVCCDATDAAAMRAVGAFDVDTAIVAIRSHFDVTVLVAHLLRENGVTEILTQVDTEQQAAAIRSFGATKVIFPPRDMALVIARRLLHPDLADSIPLGPDVAIIDIACPVAFAGQTITELGLRTHYGVNLIGIRLPPSAPGRKETSLINPAPTTRLPKESHLMLLGSLEQLAKIKALSRGPENSGSLPGPGSPDRPGRPSA